MCVGAVSRRVVEEAAKLHVHQIVASRAQVNAEGGYIGMDQFDLVSLVTNLSAGETEVIRDHGGLVKSSHDDDPGVADLELCARAGFDGLHIDVCHLPRTEQVATLVDLVKRFESSSVVIEIGGEHDEQAWNNELLDAVLTRTQVVPSYAVLDTGAYVWADRQYGYLLHRGSFDLVSAATHYRNLGVQVKAHNMDWVGQRRYYVEVLDAYNVAPELGVVETNALLTVLNPRDALAILNVAYDSWKWTRWFHDDEGTRDERARCALRYMQTDPRVEQLTQYELLSPDNGLSAKQDAYVRGCIRDAIKLG